MQRNLIYLFLLLANFSFAQIIPQNNLSVWYNADSVGLDGDKVTTLYDLSGNLNHANQLNNTNCPTWVENGINNLPALFFDGNDILNTADVSSNTVDLFIIAKGNEFSHRLLGAGIGYWININATKSIIYLTSQNYCYYSPTVDTSNYVLHNFGVSDGLASPENSFMRINGDDLITENSVYNTSFTFTDLEIGAGNLDGLIAEIIVFDAILTSEQRDSVENYLFNKYASSIDLGPDTLYVSNFCDTCLSVSGDLSDILWSTGDTLTKICVDSSGSYFVEGYDIFGARKADTIYVKYQKVELRDSVFCNGDSILYEINLGADYDYLWFDGSTFSFNFIDNPGDYWVDITDSLGCSIRRDFTVELDSFSVLFELGNDTSMCIGNKLIPENGNHYASEWFWEPGGTTDSVKLIDSEGWYKLTVSNGNGCQVVDSLYVTVKGIAPISNFDYEDTCENQQVLFLDNSSPADSIISWQWIFDYSDTLTSQNPTYNFDSSGFHNVLLEVETLNSCMGSISKSLEILPSPKPLFNYYRPCSQGVTTFDNVSEIPIGLSSNYTWEIDGEIVSNDSILYYEFTDTGKYFVELLVDIENGCVASFGDSVLIKNDYDLPASFDLVEPVNNTIENNDFINFSWNESDNAFKYELLLSSSLLFADTIVEYKDLEVTEYEVENNFSNDTIYWKVEALNTCGEKISSNTNVFSVFRVNELNNLIAWYSADSVIFEQDSTINSMVDMSGLNNDASQEGLSQMPYVKLSTDFNKPLISFNGGQVLNTSGFSTENLELFLLSKARSTSNKIFGFGNGYWVNSIIDTTRAIMFLGNNNYQYYRFNQSTRKPFIQNFAINSGSAGNDSSFLTINQNNLERLNSILGSGFIIDDLLIGSQMYEGEIFEIIVFNQLVDSLERIQIQNYLRLKYAPMVNLGGDVSIPYGFLDTTITTASKPWFTSYQWSTSENDTLSTLTVSEPGTYAVTVTDIFGFESSDSLKVRYPEFNLWESRSICLGNTLVWDLDAKGPYSYEWSTGATDTAIQVFEAGTYTVTLTDTMGNQWSPEPVVIAIDSFPVNATLGPDLTLCAGNRLELEVGQDEAVDFLWQDGSTLPYYRINETEEVSVRVINNLGCVAYDTIQVDVAGTAPKADFSYGTTCRDLNVQFADLSETFDGSVIDAYEWDFGSYGASSQQNPEFAFPDTGMIEVTLFIETNAGCDNDTSLMLDIHELPVANFSNSQACENATVQMNNTSVSADGEIVSSHWLIGEDEYNVEDPMHTFGVSGAIQTQLVVSTEFDCPDTVSRAITIKPAPDANFSYNVACLGEPVYFTNLSTANLNQQFMSQWQFGDLGSSGVQNPFFVFDNLETQNVKLVVRQLADGCTDTLSEIIQVHNLPEASVPEQTGCEGVENILNHNSSWGEGEGSGLVVWRFADTVLTGNLPVFNASEAGTYSLTVQVKNAAGCEDTVNYEYVVNESPEVGFAPLSDTTFFPTSIALENTSDPVQWSWFVNDNQISTDENPVVDIDSAGLYVIRLRGLSDEGCEDTHIDSTLALSPFVDGGIMECRSVINEGRLYVSVDLANLGTKRITNPELRLTLSNGQMFAETFAGSLYPGEIETYTFRTQYFIPENVSLRWLIVELQYAQDQANGNNECTYVFGDEPMIYPPYPNPASAIINLDFTASQEGNVKIVMYNLMGRIVLNETRDASIGLNRFEIPNPAPSGGVHTMEVEVNGKRKTFRIIL